MEIYLVTDGDAADYRVLAVFTDRDAAEAFILGQATTEGRIYHNELNIEVWQANQPEAAHQPYAYNIDEARWYVAPMTETVPLYP